MFGSRGDQQTPQCAHQRSHSRANDHSIVLERTAPGVRLSFCSPTGAPSEWWSIRSSVFQRETIQPFPFGSAVAAIFNSWCAVVASKETTSALEIGFSAGVDRHSAQELISIIFCEALTRSPAIWLGSPAAETGLHQCSLRLQHTRTTPAE